MKWRTATTRCSSSTTAAAGRRVPQGRRDTDNSRARNGTLDMQASLSSVMVTLVSHRLPRRLPDAMVHVHNLGGNIPYRSSAWTPLPARHAERGAAVVALPQGERLRGLQLIRPARNRGGRRLYGAERIVCGTDARHEFGVDWTRKASRSADCEEAREQILHRNAAAMLARRRKERAARKRRRLILRGPAADPGAAGARVAWQLVTPFRRSGHRRQPGNGNAQGRPGRRRLTIRRASSRRSAPR